MTLFVAVPVSIAFDHPGCFPPSKGEGMEFTFLDVSTLWVGLPFCSHWWWWWWCLAEGMYSLMYNLDHTGGLVFPTYMKFWLRWTLQKEEACGITALGLAHPNLRRSV